MANMKHLRHTHAMRTPLTSRKARALLAALAVAIPALPAVAQPAPASAPMESGAGQPLEVVAPIEIQRYMGLWYEQARLPNRFQEKCAGQVSARYSLRADGRVDVLNRCARAPGEVEEALGEARTVPVAGKPDAGRLEVRFAPAWLSWLPLVWGDYWILRLEPDYSMALVGTPDRKFLWVLAREARPAEARVQALLSHARDAGFDVGKVIRTPVEPALPRD
jgi:apolipoprotein D and lipocalin family protein